MRNSMSILTFGSKVDFDMSSLNKFVDLFADYKEIKAGEEEFFLDMSKSMEYDKYSISEKELVAFFSKVKNDM